MGDITCLPLVGGRWCYLATWRDTYSRRMVGGQLDRHMSTELIVSALNQELTLCQPGPDLIIHADRGIPATLKSNGAGHSRAVLPSLTDGRLAAFDSTNLTNAFFLIKE
ncbi:MAG: DDE-type integrase/transposase/recombinase [Janthinobacterium lividum]